jgi:hypothetical protein
MQFDARAPIVVIKETPETESTNEARAIAS